MGGRGSSFGGSGGGGGGSQSYFDKEKERILKEYAKKDGTLSATGKMAMKNLEFQQYRFNGLEWGKASNKYYRVQQYAKNSDNAIIKVADEHLFKTPYGYGFKTDADHVVYLKDWQVNKNYFGNYIIANKKYWKESQSKKSDNNLMSYGKESKYRLDTFDKVKDVAREQSKVSGNRIRWDRKGGDL